MQCSRRSSLGAEFRTGKWLVQPEACRILSGNEELHLRPLMMTLLVTLAEHAGEVLSKERILELVWEASFVSESSLTREVAELRRIMGDDRKDPQYIETIPKRGYRFIARVEPAKRLTGPRMAVLLFENLNRDPDLDYFADGLSDVLITELGCITSLRVISRQSTLRYRNSDKSLQDIARELRADAIVEGSTLHVGDRVRINAQLIRADPEEHLWARDYDCQIGDALSIQSRVARAIAESVHATLTPQESARLSREIRGGPEVHVAYLKARFHLMRWTRDDFQRGLEYLNEVTEKDPTFAPAYELRATSLLALGFWGHTPSSAITKQATESALKAVELDDSLGEGHATLGLAKMSLDPVAAEQELMRAIHLNPSSPFVRLSYALFLQRVRRDSRGSIEQAELALEADPVSEHTNFSYAWILFFAGEYRRSAEQANKTLTMYRDSLMANFVLGWAQLGCANADRAVAAFERAVELSRDAIGLGYLGHAYGLAGHREAALSVLDELLKKSIVEEVPQTCLAYLYVGLGDFDRAFESLDKCFRQRDSRLYWFPLTIFCDEFRSDPRFGALLNKLASRAGELPRESSSYPAAV